MSGLDTEPGATVFQVFAATYDKVHEPIFAKIDFDVDVDARRATLKVPGIIDARGEPIRNPVTGDEHRVRINLPHGFEYTVQPRLVENLHGSEDVQTLLSRHLDQRFPSEGRFTILSRQ